MPYERYSAPPPDAAPPPEPSVWRRKLGLYWLLIRGDRPVGTLLLLWPTWWALWVAAEGVPPLGILAIFTAGVWLTRSAGCVINDYNDRWLDWQVDRTKARPMATGEVEPREGLMLFGVLMLVAFGLVLLTNWLTVALSVVAAVLASTYPLLKRHTYLPQVYLGIAFGWGIPMAFAAVQGTVPPIAWLLFLGNLLWTTGYDTWYAMVDREDDIRAGSKSTAILFGDADLVAQAVIYAGFLWAMWLVGVRAEFGPHYQGALGLAAAVVLVQFWIARGRGREACFLAFRANQWVGLLVFAGIAGHYALG
jgi:4-hydroxybenzoate polyprenyltransferase